MSCHGMTWILRHAIPWLGFLFCWACIWYAIAWFFFLSMAWHKIWQRMDSISRHGTALILWKSMAWILEWIQCCGMDFGMASMWWHSPHRFLNAFHDVEWILEWIPRSRMVFGMNSMQWRGFWLGFHTVAWILARIPLSWYRFGHGFQAVAWFLALHGIGFGITWHWFWHGFHAVA